jgi:ABC-type glutathione transport system ATPase component
VRPGLLCDEITSALDPELVSEGLRVVEQLARDGMTLMLVTHEMRFARDVGTKLVFMHHGKVHEEGRPKKLFTSPNTPELAQFIGSNGLKSVASSPTRFMTTLSLLSPPCASNVQTDTGRCSRLSNLTGHLTLTMCFQQSEQALAHKDSRPIRGHMHLDLTIYVDNGIGVGGLQYVAILLDDGRVPIDQFLRGTVFFSIVAE